MEFYIGGIIPFAGNYAPRGWACCDGQLEAIGQNQALFSLLGTTFGGDGRTVFALPDLRGRVAIHPGQGRGLSYYNWGEIGGSESVTLLTSQIPHHTHAGTCNIGASSKLGTETDPEGLCIAIPNDGSRNPILYPSFSPSPDTTLAPATVLIGNTGGSLPHTNLQPYIGIFHVICMYYGVYPSRN
ncbi:Microcystin-dependent protein [Oceanospirillum multiglobuliferum]|uniref:Phage tail collar domain-containing protein n=1 Tax=Oceanospirillum multiglobuliferum TaxID=64969 RepID=A0A1T4LVP0_9GAMM|nr:tail fiber protein [Oceanospirillum multiglobuliferum]OPX56344.1 hypothetical protein BTE48_05090 [Oceanospirillum multiglobuliferum]SJZ58752.1 Microcystin-dependent protein [Oceanospirillum multiglobuliferum]